MTHIPLFLIADAVKRKEKETEIQIEIDFDAGVGVCAAELARHGD
jgi:hypothetical protein